MRPQSKRNCVIAGAVAAVMLVPGMAGASPTCTIEVASGLRKPLGIAWSPERNLIVSETGITGVLHSGRISILGTDGHRRTLVDGLPSAINDVGDASGPAGVIMRGRTLYVPIGIGDSIVPIGTTPFRAGNPTPSSRLFSSVLAIHFSAHVERTTQGFTLTTADEEAIASGEKVILGNGHGQRLAIELVANFPDYVPNPVPPAPDNVQGSNPFDLALIDDELYVTDGGRNVVWEIDLHSGAYRSLVTFPSIPNPAFPAVGGPTVEAVPTGIRAFRRQLFVALFRGFPFAPGTASIEQIDPETAAHAPALTGLRTAIDVQPTRDGKVGIGLFVLQHTSGPLLPPFSGPGLLTHTNASGTVELAGCFTRPTSMVVDRKSGAVYVTEYGGRVVVVP